MRRVLIPMFVLLSLVMSACAAPTTPSPVTSTPVPAATKPAEEGLSGTISVAGSTTVQPLAEKLAQAFIARHPKVRIDVQGGGSSVGVKSAGQGTVDVGMASREVKQSELDEFKGMQVFVIAWDGIAIVAHPGVGVSNVSMEQLKNIFAGEITNWKEVGGPDQTIVVAAREEGSGTRAAFEELVMGDELITDMAILQPSNGAIRTTVSTTPWCISFLSFGYLDESVTVLAVDGVLGTEENVAAGTYPVVRPLNLMTQGQPEGLAKAWLDFIMSNDGQEIVAAEGYIKAK